MPPLRRDATAEGAPAGCAIQLRSHVDHDDAAITVIAGRRRNTAVLVMGRFERKIDPTGLTVAPPLLLAPSDLFDDPRIQHRITSPLVLPGGYKTVLKGVKNAAGPTTTRHSTDAVMQGLRLAPCRRTR